MMPNITDISDYEAGAIAQEDMVGFFQGMINSGVVWRLQGHYGRTAAALIEAGDCMTADAFTATEADECENMLVNGQFGVGA